MTSSVKHILMSFNMLSANFLVLQKKLMLSANGMRWTESDVWVRVNNMFNLVRLRRSHIVNRMWDTFVASIAI